VRQWLDDTHPALEKQARKEAADVYRCDETGVAADRQPRYGYAREGARAVMRVPPKHIRVNLISAINADGPVRFMTCQGAMNAGLFLVFLKRPSWSTTHKIFLIVDHLPAHGKSSVRHRLERRQDRIEMFYLPCYAPERNPDEYLNNDLKGNVNGAGLPHTKEELRTRLQRFMGGLLRSPERVSCYFRHLDVQYAAVHYSWECLMPP